jgi:hypothetical protein
LGGLAENAGDVAVVHEEDYRPTKKLERAFGLS